MKTRFLLLGLVVLLVVTGCRKPEASSDSEIVYRENALSSRYSEFPKLPVITVEPDPDGVTLEGVGFAADGGYIMVSYSGPKELLSTFRQDDVYVYDESTRGVYKDIPVMPIIGPLVGKPGTDGQKGYTMLLNYYGGIKSGSVVSVVLGKYKREHYVIP